MDVKPELTHDALTDSQRLLSDITRRRARELIGFTDLQAAFKGYQTGLRSYTSRDQPSAKATQTKRKPRPKQIKRKRHKPIQRKRS